MRILALCAVCVALFAQVSESRSAEHVARNGSSATQDQTSGSNPESLKSPSEITVVVNESVIVEQPLGIRRIAIASGDIAEAAAASAREVLLNGKSPGDTTLLVWDVKGNRRMYEVHVRANTASLDGIRRELTKEVGPDVSMNVEGGAVFLRGTVKDSIAADRAVAIASTLGKVVNLLQVTVPAAEPQILLRVRFADIDRSAALQVGLNLFSMDPYQGIGTSTTGQFGSVPVWNLSQQSGTKSLTWSMSNLLNLSYYNPEINLGAILQDLQAKNVLQILAEPNLLTLSGRPASFLAGGEFPFPTLQGGGAGVGQITIQFKEFGIRLNFLPTVTPRGTIHLVVSPEVSSLDYANGLTVNGFSIPGLDTRRVQTEVELRSGQSFVIAGLLDNQSTEQLDKMPGIGSIPILGKLFQSKSYTRSKTELLVMVTPELVGPIPAGVKPPDVTFPSRFMEGGLKTPPQNPGPQVTGGVPALVIPTTVPVEQVKNWSGTSVAPAPAGEQPAPVAPPLLNPSPPQQTSPATPSGPPNAGSNK